MKAVYGAAVVMAALGTVGCGGGGQVSLATLEDSASYAIGMNMGQSLAEIRDQVNLDALEAGLTDAAEGSETTLTPGEAMTVMQAFMTQLQQAQGEEMSGAATANREQGDAYREENGQREGVTTTESGLQYEVLEAGSGPPPAATDQVRVHYRGSLVDGTEFETSYGGEPATFRLNEVVPGWTEALQLMNAGSKYRIVLPPELGYGNRGGPGGPGSTLVFEVELLEIL
jgi:FKBP-type peptidyl-prolyl cis-trans isomerase